MKLSVDVEDSEVVDRTLRFYLSRRARTSQAMSELTEEEAMQIANEELRAMRRERPSAA
jgi:hypothetical protein